MKTDSPAAAPVAEWLVPHGVRQSHETTVREQIFRDQHGRGKSRPWGGANTIVGNPKLPIYSPDRKSDKIPRRGQGRCEAEFLCNRADSRYDDVSGKLCLGSILAFQGRISLFTSQEKSIGVSQQTAGKHRLWCLRRIHGTVVVIPLSGRV